MHDHHHDMQLTHELELGELVHELLLELRGTRPGAETQKLLLSRTGAQANLRGNPVDWAGPRARTIAVWNPNAFTVQLGSGAAGGVAGSRQVDVPAKSLAVLPIEADVYSIGTADANLAGGDAEVWVARYEEALPPALYQWT